MPFLYLNLYSNHLTLTLPTLSEKLSAVEPLHARAQAIWSRIEACAERMRAAHALLSAVKAQQTEVVGRMQREVQALDVAVEKKQEERNAMTETQWREFLKDKRSTLATLNDQRIWAVAVTKKVTELISEVESFANELMRESERIQEILRWIERFIG